MSLAILFPGQGSQSVGMLSALGQQFAALRDTFTEASDILGWDLWTLSQAGPEAELNRTEKTQPVLLTASVALWRIWCASRGERPAAMAGHSLGEYSALVCAGAMAFGDALRLVERRGQLMQRAVPQGRGAMAAIVGLEDEAVSLLCTELAQGQVLEPVNYNAPGQVVVAGDRDAVERAAAEAKGRGARLARVLAVSVPAHSSLMRAAASEFEAALDEVAVSAPTLPVLHNLDACPREDPDAIRSALVAQLHNPVRWTQTVRRMVGEGANTFVECGPGKVLCGLVKRIDRGVRALPLTVPGDLEAALAATAGVEQQ